jgi:ADP-ribose pyrophosphatase YjhB (NUDIX family)
LSWQLPAGGVEDGETVEQAAVRETKEETSLTGSAVKVLGGRLHPITGRHMSYVGAARLEGQRTLALLCAAVPAEQSSTGVVEYHTPLRTVALSTGFFGLITTAMTYFAVAGHGPGVVVAALTAALFAFLVARSIVRAALRRPFAVITDEGMRFNARGHVSWDEIVSVAVFLGTSGYSWKGFIGIELHDPEAYLARIGYNQRRVARIGIARGLGPIRLPGEGFPVSMEEVVAAMSRFHPGLVVNT